MTDIVERLRADFTQEDLGWPDMVELCAEAAAELERLRDENMFLRSLVADELRALEPKP